MRTHCGEVGPPYCTEENDEGRLDGVDNEGEENGGLLGNAIKDEHRLDGEMPGACTVRRGDEDGEGADAEDEESGERVDAAREVEGEEGEVEMQVIACPDAYAIKEIEREVVDLAERDESVDKALHTGVDLAEEVETAEQEPQEDDGGHAADDGDPPTRRREAPHEGMDVEARLEEELLEHGQLAEEGDDGDEDHEGGVDDALRNDGTEALGEGDAPVLLEGAAARHFADTGNDEARRVAQEDGVGAEPRGGFLAHRFEGHPPAQGTKGEGHNAEGEAQEHPSPMDVVGDAAEHLAPICPAVHPPQYANCEGKGHKDVQIFKELFHQLRVF